MAALARFCWYKGFHLCWLAEIQLIFADWSISVCIFKYCWVDHYNKSVQFAQWEKKNNVFPSVRSCMHCKLYLCTNSSSLQYACRIYIRHIMCIFTVKTCFCSIVHFHTHTFLYWYHFTRQHKINLVAQLEIIMYQQLLQVKVSINTFWKCCHF